MWRIVNNILRVPTGAAARIRALGTSILTFSSKGGPDIEWPDTIGTAGQAMAVASVDPPRLGWASSVPGGGTIGQQLMWGVSGAPTWVTPVALSAGETDPTISNELLYGPTNPSGIAPSPAFTYALKRVRYRQIDTLIFADVCIRIYAAGAVDDAEHLKLELSLPIAIPADFAAAEDASGHGLAVARNDLTADTTALLVTAVPSTNRVQLYGPIPAGLDGLDVTLHATFSYSIAPPPPEE